MGVGLSWLGLGLVLHFAVTSPPPFWFVFNIDRPILLFVIGASALAAVVAGETARASRVRWPCERDAERRRPGRVVVSPWTSSRLLVIVELGLSVGLLVPAGLFVRVWSGCGRSTTGSSSQEVMTAQVELFETDFPTPESRRQFFGRLRQRLMDCPGISSASLVGVLPGLGSRRVRIARPDTQYADELAYPEVGLVVASPGFLETFGVDPIAGRDFTASDDEQSARVAIP